jgi:hypothetical protein
LNLKEESLINNSLKSLSRCISSLCNDSVQDKYVPYRENTFTKVVSTSLEGDHICLFLCQMRNDFGDSLRNFQILSWLANLQSEIEEVLVFDDDLEAIASMLEQQLANESEKQMILDQELSEVRCDEKYESAVNFGSQLLDVICEFSVISDSYFREVCQEYLCFKKLYSTISAWKSLKVDCNHDDVKVDFRTRIEKVQQDFWNFKKELCIRVEVLVKEASNALAPYDFLMVEKAGSQLLRLLGSQGHHLKQISFQLESIVSFVILFKPIF